MERIKTADNAVVVNGKPQFAESLPPLEPTLIRDYWLNAVQEEIAGAIEGTGLALTAGDNSQLLTALRMISPTGMVSAFAGAAAPAGWLLCNGAVLSQAAYPRLFAVIGSTYDTARNTLTGAAYASPGAGNFRLPDYRSVFLRGVGTTNLGQVVTLGVWNDQATAKNGLALTNGSYSLDVTHPSVNYTAQALGGTTTFAASGHEHGTAIAYDGNFAYISNRLSVGGDSPGSITVRPITLGATESRNTSYQGTTTPNETATVTITTGSVTLTNGTYTLNGSAPVLGNGNVETRPINVGVNYIIRT